MLMRVPLYRRRRSEETATGRGPAQAPIPVSDDLALALVESLSDPVVACHEDGTTIAANRSARELLDELAAASPGEERWGLPRPIAMPLARALGGQRISDLEVEVRDSAGPRILSLSGGPVRNERGRTQGAALVMHDVTERAGDDSAGSLLGEAAARMAAGLALVRVSDGEIVYANEALERMVGYQHGELAGRHMSAVTAPLESAPAAWTQELMRSLRRDGAWSGEIHNVRKDGTDFWCAANIASFEHPEHGPTLIVAETEISRLRAARESLRMAEERFRRLFEQAPVGIAVVGNDLRLIDANEAVSDITGYRRDRLLGRTLASLTHPNDVDLDAELSAQVFRGEISSYRVDKRLVSEEGRVVAVSLTATCLRDSAGRPEHWIVVLQPSGR